MVAISKTVLEAEYSLLAKLRQQHKLNENTMDWDGILHPIQIPIQWGLEYRTCSVFGWSMMLGFRMVFGF